MSIEVGRIGELGQKNTDTGGAVSVDISEVSYCYINNLPISLECLYRILGI